MSGRKKPSPHTASPLGPSPTTRLVRVTLALLLLLLLVLAAAAAAPAPAPGAGAAGAGAVLLQLLSRLVRLMRA